jgi:geranylgeranyl pyrophosphate synthase
VYTLPVLHALHEGPHRDELQRLLTHGAPDGEMLDRALEIVRTGGSIDHARRAVAAEVRRAVDLASQLPDGAARHALIQLARFLAVRCGAEVPA